MEKMKQKKGIELDHNLTNMLIHLYNGKQCGEYIKEYKTILDSVISLIILILIAYLDQEELWVAVYRSVEQI
jgi:hypothetical protein